MKNTRTNTQGVKQVALSNSAKTRERERERESNSALNLSSPHSSNYKTYKATSVITDKGYISVIASERSERGNLHFNIDKIDCHDSTLRAESRNDGVISPSLAEGARGWVSCHTERSEVSQNTQINRDISRSRAQYDNKRDASISTKSQYDDKHSVIASKSQDLRGNPHYDIDKVDCHDSTLRAESRNDTHPQTPPQ